MQLEAPAEILERMGTDPLCGYSVSVLSNGQPEDLSFSYNAMKRLSEYVPDGDTFAKFMAAILKRCEEDRFFLSISLDDTEDSAFCIWRSKKDVIMVDAAVYEDLGNGRIPVPRSLKLSAKERKAINEIFSTTNSLFSAERPKGYSGNN